MNVMNQLLLDGIRVAPVGENKHIRPEMMVFNHDRLLTRSSTGTWYRFGNWGEIETILGKHLVSPRRVWHVVNLSWGFAIRRLFSDNTWYTEPGSPGFLVAYETQDEAQRDADRLNRRDDQTIARTR